MHCLEQNEYIIDVSYIKVDNKLKYLLKLGINTGRHIGTSCTATR